MASQNEDGTRRRRSKPKKSSAQDAQSGRGSHSQRDEGEPRRSETRHAHADPLSSSTTRPGRSGARRSSRSRASSPSTVPASVPTANTPTNYMGSAGFATGEDFIAFDFSDSEAWDDTLQPNQSAGKGKGRDQGYSEGLDRRNGLKRSASQMEAEDDGYANKKQRMDAASRLTPWAEDVDWDSCRNIAEMMHKEVKAFVTYISPRSEEHEVRRMIIATIARAVRSSWPDAQVSAFGSFETKLYLPLGDIDLVIQSSTMERYEKRQILYNLAQVLRKANITDNVTVIAKAKVPIVKFVTSLGRFAVDISLNQGNGIVAVRVVNRFLGELPALRSLVMVIKLFLSQRSMNEVYTGGLGSYAIVCMAVSFLQMHPKVRLGEIDPSENLGVLVMEFFELYGHYFNYDNTGISIREGGTYFNKEARGWVDYRQTSLLSIEDPNDISNDISRSSYNITRVRKTLAGAHEVLTSAAFMRARVLSSKAQGQYTSLRAPGSRDREYDNPSILGSVLGVTQETLNHRRLVKQLFEHSTLQNILGLAPYRPIAVVADRESTPRSRAASKHISTSRSAKAVETAWGEADMDLSQSDDELLGQRLASPEVEESRYSKRNSRKRRKVDTNGKHSTQDAIYVAESDEEELVKSHPRRAPPDLEAGESPSSVRDARSDQREARSRVKQEGRRAYWASKATSGGSLEDAGTI